jgi:hypothetical protein
MSSGSSVRSAPSVQHSAPSVGRVSSAPSHVNVAPFHSSAPSAASRASYAPVRSSPVVVRSTTSYASYAQRGGTTTSAPSTSRGGSSDQRASAPAPSVRYESARSAPEVSAPSPRSAESAGRSGSQAPAPTRSDTSGSSAGRSSGPSVRYYDSGRTGIESRGTSRPDGSRSQSEAPSARSAQPGTDRSSGDSGVRVWQEPRVTDDTMIDLSEARAPQRTRVPAVYGSNPAERRGPAAERTARRDSPADTGRVRLPSQPITRDSILERYREPGRSRAGTSAEIEGRGTDLSRQRGIAPQRSSESPRTAADRPAVRRTPAPTTAELRQQNERHQMHRLQVLAQTQPAKARALYNQSQGIYHATSAGVHLGVAAAFGVAGCGGWNGFCPPGPYPPGTWGWWSGCWSNWCGPGSWWWWNSCGYWGSGWGWGLSFGYGWPYSYWNYPAYPYYSCWSAWPAWYSYAVYDHVDPAPAPVVIYEQAPAAEAEQAPAAQGEASVEVREPAGKQDRPSDLTETLGRAAGHYLTLGDRAFREGRYGDAVHFYAKAVEFSPNDGVLYLILSDSLFATGDYHYAAYALKRALELDPRLADSAVDKHGFYNDPEEFERQLRVLERYLDDHFLDDDARLVLAANYLFGKQPERAVDLLDSAFSSTVRESAAGSILLERARALRADAARPH